MLTYCWITLFPKHSHSPCPNSHISSHLDCASILSCHLQRYPQSIVFLSPQNTLYLLENLQLWFLKLRVSHILHSSLMVAAKFPQIHVSHFSVWPAFYEHNPVRTWNMHLSLVQILTHCCYLVACKGSKQKQPTSDIFLVFTWYSVLYE
jgi:hypothetical protein